MTRVHSHRLAIALMLLAALVGCDRPQDRPSAAAKPGDTSAWVQQTFDTNCRGCHSQGAEGAALPLQSAQYWKVATDDVVTYAIAHGQGRSMPAFAQSDGGPFTPADVASLVRGMRALWSDGSAAGGAGISPVVVAGDALAGAATFDSACASCHGTGGRAGSVIDPMYLRLISDQGLWSAVVYGRSALGMPAWNDAMPDHPRGLTAQEVANVVQFMSSHRDRTSSGGTP